MPLTSRWITSTESAFPWERDALDYLRDRLPDVEPVRAWSNVEFVSLDGRINEVDLIVLTSKGMFLVEIKSRPGEVSGDQQRWTWHDGASRFEIDNPLRLANLKSKRLAELLAHQRVVGKSTRLPFIEPLIFCSAPGVKLRLPEPLSLKVFGREPGGDGGVGTAPGIVSALTDRRVGPASSVPIDANMARIVSRAMAEAGLRSSVKAEQVGDYKLGALLGEGPAWQDYEATHVALNARRRVRLYPIPLKASAERRQTVIRAAKREFEILEGIHHPGIVRADDYRETERGPALIFPFDPQALRLDAFITQQAARLDETLRLHLLRSIAEIVGYAHKRRLFHRALSPQSVFVSDPDAAEPRVTIGNWQAGTRAGGTSIGIGSSGTEHVDAVIDDASQVYVAPEARLGNGQYEAALDVFSLGAIAYHLFTGLPPADSIITLHDKLRAQGGLIVSEVLNAATPALLDLVKAATAPDVTMRLGTVDEFLEYLSLVEDELTRPEPAAEVNPIDAQKGDRLKGNLEVVRRLGKGATAVALLVTRGEQEFVLKVAQSPEHNARLHAEAEVLRELRHQHIVAIHDEFEVAGVVALLLDKAGEITLGRRLHDDGPLHLDWLERFGEDLLSTVDWLEQKGIPHRDLKPDNIGITAIGRGDRQHLLLFDFSLAREAAENIRSGTPPYLDPFLKTRKPQRWDLHAERFAAAMTLYQMATARLPKWTDGTSDPAFVNAEVTLESELFDPVLRDALTAFFHKSLAREASARFDNARDMLGAWRQVFVRVEGAAALPADEMPLADETMAQVFSAAFGTATLETPLVQLGLSTRALNALERLGCTTVGQLVEQSVAAVWRLPGVGHKTRREIATVTSSLKRKFPVASPATAVATAVQPSEGDEQPAGDGLPSVDTLSARLLPKKVSGGKSEERILPVWLGLEGADTDTPGLWPSQTDIARRAGLTRARVSQLVVKARERWRRDALLTGLRTDIVEIINQQGGVVSSEELAGAVLAVRGSVKDEPHRTHRAHAVVRAAIEVEMAQATPRVNVRRTTRTVLVATIVKEADDIDLTEWAESLGRVADGLADRDPLVSPETALTALREEGTPGLKEPLADARLLRLAAAASTHAALSGRDELYPRGMAAFQALRFSKNLFTTRGDLTVDQIRERVSSRYPQAEPLPDRPELDALLAAAEFDVEWSHEAAGGRGGYHSTSQYRIAVPTFSSSVSRSATQPGQQVVAPGAEVIDARAFEARLQYGTRNGQFLVLSASPRDIRRAGEELLRFDAEPVSVDALLLQAMKDVAAAAPVAWDVVIRADAAGKQSAEWRNLKALVERAMPKVKTALAAPGRVRLVTNLGLLARYGKLGLFDELRHIVGNPGALQTLWVLVPSVGLNPLPTVDGVPIPLIGAQSAAIPEAWLRNLHRAA